MSLLSRLFVLVAVALLPAIAIQAYIELDLRRSRQIEVHDQALGLAKLAAAEQQQIVQGIRQVLIALSELPAIKAKDSQACDAYLSAIKRRYPAFLTFLVVDTNGRSFCDTNSDHKPVVVDGRAYFATATKTGAFTVGRFSIGHSTGRNVLQFALPFYGADAHLGGMVIAALGLDWLADHLAQKGVPQGATLAIADRDGTYLARYPDNDRFVGRKMPGSEFRSMRRPGTADERDLDGVERIIGYSTLQADSGALLVSVGLDKTQAFSEIAGRTRRGILLIILGTSVVLGLTWAGAHQFIHRPLGHLVEAANQWRLGDYSRRVNIREQQSEIARVGAAFNTMAAALEDRERELRKAKEKAEEAAARITTIFESTTDSVLVVDRAWRIAYVNERAKAQVADGRDLVGMELWAAFPEAARDVQAQYRNVVAERVPASFEMFLNGRNAWYAVNAFPSSEGLAVYFRDVTEHKRALEERRLFEEQLHQSQKMEAVGQLTGGIAHDFNNLLAVVTGNLELIERRAADDSRTRELAEAARKAADRGARLTKQLLAFSRRQELQPELVYADRLIRDFQELIRRAVGDGCGIELIAEERLWPCHVDPAQLETALLNLTLNGRDAMPNGGLLTIAVRNVVVDGKVAGLAPGSYVSLSVRDTGCGMPPSTLERVFEPFFTTKDPGKGTGLGLSMVYGFARQSGGHVAIESAVGLGTTVTLYLPKAEPPSHSEAEAACEAAIPTGSGRILLVDDNEPLLTVTSAMLTELGYQVVAAQSAREALGILKSNGRFDLLFSDVGLPHAMNGVELAREAKRLRKGIKVLLTSGNAADQLAQHDTADEFPLISKPFYRAELARRMWSVLRDAV